MDIPKNWNKVKLENFIHYTEYLDEEAGSIVEKINLLKKKTCALDRDWEIHILKTFILF